MLIMKRILLLPLLALLVASCSQEIEDNSPALQAVVNDSILYKSIDARAFFNDQGDLVINGTTDVEKLNLLFRSTNGPQGFGSCCANVAAFENVDGRVFSTAPNGEGFARVNVTDRFVSGSFNFTAYRPGNRDTLTFSKGVFFEVPLVAPFDADEDDDDGAVPDSFTARVNTVSFNPTVTAGVLSGGILTVSGQTSNTSISLTLPSNTDAGSYDITETGSFTANYRAMGTDNPATSGTLTVTSNDTAAKLIKGEFTFETGSFSVTGGRFTINY